MYEENRLLKDNFISLKSTVDHLSRQQQYLSAHVGLLERRVISLEEANGRNIVRDKDGGDNTSGSFELPLPRIIPEPCESTSKTPHLCDYCYRMSKNCFHCAQCGQEWYCSEHCQRLRSIVHEPICRGFCKTTYTERV
ncbi:unnamed protein product [Phytomonas sp. Hart1]|nr:unnamed protein product [Phytomonas sp. Hart1]|eukprot:CCW70386.1 unnamed protein product [Phytomonas sp. isolate Hart1]